MSILQHQLSPHARVCVCVRILGFGKPTHIGNMLMSSNLKNQFYVSA